MKLLNKIWTELNRVREIRVEFVNYPTQEELYKEFYKRIIELREKNSKELFNKIEPQIVDKLVLKYGYIPSRLEITLECLKEVERKLREGEIDTFYKEIEKDV